MAERKTVIIDAGHGGANPGAVYMGRQEKDDALRLALAVGNLLEQSGVNVLYTRVNDVFDTPLEKAQMGNQSGADYFISIHRNAMPIPGSASGAEVLVYQDEGGPALLAENISRNLTEAGFADLGVKERPGLIVLRRTQMPAVLVEVGFINTDADNELFDSRFDEIARPEYYQVQVGAYRDRVPADRLLKELESRGLPAFIVHDDGYYKVRVGAFLNMDNAANMERILRNMGYPTLMVREQAVY